MSAWCAICAEDIHGEPLRRPLGKGDALVNVCVACDTEPAVEKRGVERDWEPNGGLPTYEQGVRGARNALGLAATSKGSQAQRMTMRSPINYARETGWEIVRIARRNESGEVRDRFEAWKVVGNPLAKFIAVDDLHYVYQVPPTVKLSSEGGELDAIDAFRTSGGAK